MTTNPRLRQAGVAAVLTLGLTALVGVLPGPSFLVPAVAVFGWFIVTPLLATYGVPGLDAEEQPDDARRRDPLDVLQERYAAGEITEAEFERRVQRILESDEAVRGTERLPADGVTVEADAEADREFERDLE